MKRSTVLLPGCVFLWACSANPSAPPGSQLPIDAGGDANRANRDARERDADPGAADVLPGAKDASLPAEGGAKDGGATVDMGGAEAGSPPANALDDCFRNVPAPSGYQEIQTKITVDGQTRVRLLLDTEDRSGTSGSHIYGLLRFGLVRANQPPVCVTNRSDLGYMFTHHNFKDVATAVANGIAYKINLNLSYGPPITRTEEISATMGGATLWGPIKLKDVACVSSEPKMMKCVHRSL